MVNSNWQETISVLPFEKEKTVLELVECLTVFS